LKVALAGAFEEQVGEPTSDESDQKEIDETHGAFCGFTGCVEIPAD
jgi:hypothetical protein